MIHIWNFRSQWPHGLKRTSAAARLMRLWVGIPPGDMDTSLLWVLRVLSGRSLCDELITRPEESYWLWCVVVRDVETSWMRSPGQLGGGRMLREKHTKIKKKNIFFFKNFSFSKPVAVRKMTTCCLGESFSSVSVFFTVLQGVLWNWLRSLCVLSGNYSDFGGLGVGCCL